LSQNIYDNEEFFKGYSQLNRSVKGLDGAPDWPALRAMLPPLSSASVLDLGCGFGWFCRWARQNGAAAVVGIDLSEKMLAQAAAMTKDPAITYQRIDLEQLVLGPAAFNLVYSSLTFHYIVHLERLLAEIYRALLPGGSLVFSVEHPIYSAPSNPRWQRDAAGHQTWPLDSYQVEGPRATDWFTKGVIRQHRLIATYLNLLIRLGFTLQHLEEWRPTDEQIREDPDLSQEKERPMFLLVAARR
jgi:ubiquinone/menaquinone biosynthesis C-methylase UbiE